MSDFYLPKTFNTPEIQIVSSQGVINMEGRAIPEDPGEFFEDFIRHLNEYYLMPQTLTRFDIKLEYVNSGSSKYLLEFLRIVKLNYDKGYDCIVSWFYEEDDESMKELGLHFKDTIKVPFRMVEYY